MTDGPALLPIDDLPRTPLADRGELEWLSTDSPEAFHNRAAGDFTPHSIQYRFNRHGYRCPEFDIQADIRLVAIGCSYTFGLGLPQADLFHERFAQRLAEETSLSVVAWNLGLPGVSNDYIARLLYLAIPRLNPDVVLIHFTHLCRRDYATVQGEWFTYTPAWKPDDAVCKTIFDHFQALSSPYDDELNFFRNYKGIEHLLTGRCWLFSAIRPDEFRRLMPHLDRSRYVGGLDQLDLARDGRHPGRESHRALFDRYWSRFVELGGIFGLHRGAGRS
jgi:hypothetical protein